MYFTVFTFSHLLSIFNQFLIIIFQVFLFRCPCSLSFFIVFCSHLFTLLTYEFYFVFILSIFLFQCNPNGTIPYTRHTHPFSFDFSTFAFNCFPLFLSVTLFFACFSFFSYSCFFFLSFSFPTFSFIHVSPIPTLVDFLPPISRIVFVVFPFVSSLFPILFLSFGQLLSCPFFYWPYFYSIWFFLWVYSYPFVLIFPSCHFTPIATPDIKSCQMDIFPFSCTLAWCLYCASTH